MSTLWNQSIEARIHFQDVVKAGIGSGSVKLKMRAVFHNIQSAAWCHTMYFWANTNSKQVCIYQTPLTWAECDMRSIFKWSTTGLNSFSWEIMVFDYGSSFLSVRFCTSAGTLFVHPCDPHTHTHTNWT